MDKQQQFDAHLDSIVKHVAQEMKRDCLFEFQFKLSEVWPNDLYGKTKEEFRIALLQRFISLGHPCVVTDRFCKVVFK